MGGTGEVSCRIAARRIGGNKRNRDHFFGFTFCRPLKGRNSVVGREAVEKTGAGTCTCMRRNPQERNFVRSADITDVRLGGVGEGTYCEGPVVEGGRGKGENVRRKRWAAKDGRGISTRPVTQKGGVRQLR